MSEKLTTTAPAVALPAYTGLATRLEIERAGVPPRVEPWLVDGICRSRIYRYGAESLPKMVILPPSGMSFLLVARLACALSAEFQVIVWESRGCPDWEVPLDEGEVSIESQAVHLCGILEHLGIDAFHFVGWCQAAQTIVQACSTGGARPSSLSLVAPAGLGSALVASDFERNALPVYLQIAEKDEAYAAAMGRVLCASSGQHDAGGRAAEELSTLHLANPSATLRFARYMREFERAKNRTRSLVSKVVANTRTQLLHCRDDVFSHYSESVQVARANPSVKLSVLPKGGHLVIFRDPEGLAVAIREFIAESDTSAPHARARPNMAPAI